VSDWATNIEQLITYIGLLLADHLQVLENGEIQSAQRRVLEEEAEVLASGRANKAASPTGNPFQKNTIIK